MAAPEDEVPSDDVDRDLSVLEAAEHELAELERELDGLEDVEGPSSG